MLKNVNEKKVFCFFIHVSNFDRVKARFTFSFKKLSPSAEKNTNNFRNAFKTAFWF
jgi:hypothetical protein